MTIYFVAGEASADNHGAALMRALQKLDVDLNFIGRGGPQMKAIAGGRFENWIDKSGVLGLWEVIKHYGYFRKQFRATLREIEDSRPDAVVLIDYPGFNLRLARALHRRRTAHKLIYYVSPQVWAWNPGRMKKMAHWLDLMLCIFPFEAELYNESGLRAIFVGHPMIETLRMPKIGGEIDIERDPNLIALFPGSRLREVHKIFPVLVQTASELRKQKPNLRFEIAAASHELARQMEEMVNELDRAAPYLPPTRRYGATSNPLPSMRGEGRGRPGPDEWRSEALPSISKEAAGASAPPNESRSKTPLPSARGEGRVRGVPQDRQSLEIKVGEAASLMQRAFIGIVASGSATLEAAYFRLPLVLVYKVSWLTYLVGRLVVRVKFLGMPNILANKEIVPEFIQHAAQPRELARAVSRLIDEPAAREKMISELAAIISSLGDGGASENAAQAILGELGLVRESR
jgi:lipid A disaccharide synthetase